MQLQRKHTDWMWAYLFIAPTVLGLYIFFIYPMVHSVFISFTKWNHLSSPQFIGLENYQRLFADPTIFLEFKNTMFFVLVSVPLTVGISLFLANALNKKHLLGKGTFRTIFFLPYVILPVITAQIFMIVFNSRYGLINGLFKLMNLPQIAWFSNALLTRFVIVLVTLWASIGYFTVILLAGLQNISTQYYEACDIDGGSWWVKFIHITFPLVTPQLFFCLVLSIINSFKMFDYIFVFGKSNVIVRENIRTMAFGIYERGFTYLEMGYASAEAIIFSVIVLTITILQNVGQKHWVHYS
jgi:multiple sugar transport system permease protein